MIQSKQILPATGYLHITFTFRIMERKTKKPFFTYGVSKVTNNVKLHYKKIMRNAIYNGYKRVFPTGTYTMYDIKIKSYDINYYIDRYTIIKKNNKLYERWRDTEKNKTNYSLISNKKEYEIEQKGYS